MKPGNRVPYMGDFEYCTFLSDKSSIVYDPTKAGGSPQIGLNVKRVSRDTIALAQASDKIIGSLHRLESDNKAVVKLAEGVTEEKLLSDPT